MSKDNFIKWGQFILILVLLCVAVSYELKRKTDQNNISALQAENRTYKLKNGNIAISTRIITLPEKQAPKTPETKPFSKVESITKEEQEIRIDTIYVPYKDTIPCVFKKEGQFTVKEYSFKYRSDQYGLGLQNMVIHDSATYVHGVKRKWILGEETRTLDISHSNKYLITRSASHIEYKDPVRWYENGLFKFGVGVLIGAAITR